MVVGSTTELLMEIISNFAWEFSSLTDSLQNDKGFRKFNLDIKSGI
jgi:hypothetical protein